MTRRTTFPGVPFPSEAPRFILPGLSLRQLRENKDIIGRFLSLEKELSGGQPTQEQLYTALDMAVKLAHLALTRNYPDLELAQLEEVCDMNNFRSMVTSVMGASGFKLVQELPQEVAAGPSGES